MSEELSEKKWSIIKTITSLVISAITAIGVCYGIIWRMENDIENLKKDRVEDRIIIKSLSEQMNKGILENGIIATDLKNTQENVKQLNVKLDKTIELLTEILRNQKK